MNLLAIDTSTKNLSLAVSRNDQVLSYRNKKLQRPLSSSIIPGIKEVLAASGLALKDIDGYAVGLGPGSFTSLRVGLATVKGLSLSTRTPIVGVSSLDILAMNAGQVDYPICVVCDAKRKLVYSCCFRRIGNEVTKQGRYVLESIENVLKPLKGKIKFVGDAVSLYKSEIKEAKNISPVFTNAQSDVPQANQLIVIARQRFRQNQPDNIHQMVPIYLYPEHCQVRK